jgi:hypothetical protein
MTTDRDRVFGGCIGCSRLKRFLALSLQWAWYVLLAVMLFVAAAVVVLSVALLEQVLSVTPTRTYADAVVSIPVSCPLLSFDYALLHMQ